MAQFSLYIYNLQMYTHDELLKHLIRVCVIKNVDMV